MTLIIMSVFKEVKMEKVVYSQKNKSFSKILQQTEAYNSLSRIVLYGHP
jgi:hypothetical protein